MNTIIKVEIDLRPAWDNSPQAVVWLGEEFDSEGFYFEERNGSWRAEREDGLVQFYYYTSPSNGFGGRAFNVKMLDGEEQVLHGPWSSNAEAINEEFHDRKPVIEAQLMLPARTQESIFGKKKMVVKRPAEAVAGSATIEVIARHMGWPEDMSYADYMVRLYEIKRDVCARTENLTFRAETCQETIDLLVKTGSQFKR